MSLLSRLKDYLYFNHGERRGLVILLAILLIVIFGDLLMPYFIPGEEYDYTEFEKIAEAWKSRLDSMNEVRVQELTSRIPTGMPRPALKPFPFDPNGLPEEKWIEMGLSENQVRVIMNYQKKGGRFNTARDLSRIYSISESEFKILAPFVRIVQQSNDTAGSRGDRHMPGPASDSTDHDPIAWVSIPANSPVDINRADTVELMRIRGIGRTFSKRIFKYREMLGGFTHAGQLLEVYGMDTTRFATLAGQIFIDTANIRKIDINDCDISEMIRHPYIDYYIARIIVRYREKKGVIRSVNELRAGTSIPDTLLIRILPYLGI